MLSEVTSFSGMVTATLAAIVCLLSVCGIVYTAGRLRGQLDSHAHRIDVLEGKTSQLTKDIYERLSSLNNTLIRVIEQLRACQAAHNIGCAAATGRSPDDSTGSD